MKDKVIEIAKKNNGYVTNKMLKDNNIPSMYIYRLVVDEVFDKVDKGVFLLKGYIADDFYVLHLQFPNAIFCNQTALYLNGLSNNQFEGFFAVVSYNESVPKSDNLKASRSRKSTIYLGVDDIKTPFGNVVKSYDKERCICDLFIYPEKYDTEDRVYAINEYKSKYLNIDKLYAYAKELKILDKVKNVFEVIRWS